MADMLKGLMKALGVEGKVEGVEEETAQAAPFDDATLLELHKQWKKESFDNRWIWERGWMRNIHYVNNRHWIEYVRKTNEWRDVRLAKWFPKPVTNKVGEGVQALRAMFSSVNIGANVRPIGTDPKNIAVAQTCDELAPLMHEEHHMDDVMNESDFWFIVTGNSFIHTYVDRGVQYGVTEIPHEQCLACQSEHPSPAIADAGHKCPTCAQPGPFAPAMDEETGEPKITKQNGQRGRTDALSPFELAFPQTYARFEDVPYVYRLRWRAQSYYKSDPKVWAQVEKIKWSKAPNEQALQLFRSLPFHNDMGLSPFLGSGSSESEELGTTEYEIWVRPNEQFPDGAVFRVVDNGSPIILHQEETEAVPGPLPYADVEGKPFFPFSHAAFEQRGGRVYGTSPLDGVVQKQNLLNQLDAFILMIVNRMGNPLWLVPKGAEIEKFTGEPGLVVKWNPLTVGGNAKPERVDGLGVNPALFQLRETYLKDIEEGLGTYDVIKGNKPAGVEAFSAMQLLVERSQSRFSSAFKARGGLYKDWFKFALEIEREFGPNERTINVLSPARTWTMKTFQQAQLQGSFSTVVEDGSTTPKTMLGMRATVEHLNSLGFLDAHDPDQRYRVYQLFGQTNLAPTMDIHTQAALRKQQAFEDWVGDDAAVMESVQKSQQAAMEYEAKLAVEQPDPTADPMAPPQLPPPPDVNQFTPLAWKPWYDVAIHRQEFVKWANGDRIQQLIASNPKVEPLLVAHLDVMTQQMIQAMAQQAAPQGKPGGAADGAGQAMKNSNTESGGHQNAGNHAAPTK